LDNLNNDRELSMRKDSLQEDLAAFVAEGERTVCVQVIRACDFDATLEAAKHGDREAQRFMLGFLGWSQRVDTEESDWSSGCLACGTRVGPENLGGLAVMTSLDPSKASSGISAAFCTRCVAEGPKALSRLLKEGLTASVGAEWMEVH
jgi:hypothetical protein